jgi:hypothetical protein
MQTIETTMWSLALGLLLSSLGACGAPIGPDQQEAGLEKSDAGQNQPGRSDKAGYQPNARMESPGPAESHSTSKHAITDAFRRCFDSCADKSADDRLACHNNCATQVSAGSGDPTMSACPRSCIQAFGSCLAPCTDKPSEDDVASCRMQCQTHAESCVDGCG